MTTQTSNVSFHKISLAKAVSRAVTIASALVILISTIAIVAIVYTTLDKEASETLALEVNELADLFNDEISHMATPSSEQTATLVSELKDEILFVYPETRVTLIGSDGTVLFDSVLDESSLENHSQRPEFIEAVETGQSSEGRYSQSLGADTIYHARLLDDGSVLRMSMTQSSVLGLLWSVALPTIFTMAAALIILSLIVKRITKKMTKSLEELDLDNPLENKNAPEEITPLLQRLEDQRLRLDAQNKERRRFTSNASHELKTPLTIISGYSEIIANGIAKQEDVIGFADLIHKETIHMKNIVDDLLVLTRLDDADVEQAAIDMNQDVSLAEVVTSVVEQLSTAAEHNHVQIAVDIPDGVDRPDIFVKGNSRMLNELARNLVENAIRYNVEDGKVTISVYRDGSGLPILKVADTGIGIAPELREKIFERFFCIDESRSKETGGSGLGLAIVKHAANLHKAQIIVQGNEPNGSIFEIVFPREISAD